MENNYKIEKRVKDLVLMLFLDEIIHQLAIAECVGMFICGEWKMLTRFKFKMILMH